jgi:hypothetical protein
MKWKEFLKPRWEKFILPILFIIIFLFVINFFFSFGSTLDKYTCQIISLAKDLQTLGEKNQTLAFNNTLNEFMSLFQNMQNDMNQTEQEHIEPLFNFIKVIDPVIPVPCEGMSDYTCQYYPCHTCQYYISKETYNCIINIMNGNFSWIGQSTITEYKKVSFITIGLNALVLFAEGYLLSCLIVFGYSKFKKKSNF